MDQAEGMQHQDIAPTGTVPQETPQEKLLTQSEVNALIGKAKHDYYEKGKRDAIGQPAQQPAPAQASNGQSMGGMPQITEDHIRQIISDEAVKQTHIAAAQQTLANFAQQMNAGKGKYPDFDETVAKLGDLKSMSHIIQMATDTGSAGDVLYDLAKNPHKIASITVNAYSHPHLAKEQVFKLAESIKMNDSAKNASSAQEPLSQVKPSTVGMDNGSRTVSDLRKMSWARG